MERRTMRKMRVVFSFKRVLIYCIPVIIILLLLCIEPLSVALNQDNLENYFTRSVEKGDYISFVEFIRCSEESLPVNQVTLKPFITALSENESYRKRYTDDIAGSQKYIRISQGQIAVKKYEITLQPVYLNITHNLPSGSVYVNDTLVQTFQTSGLCSIGPMLPGKYTVEIRDENASLSQTAIISLPGDNGNKTGMIDFNFDRKSVLNR